MHAFNGSPLATLHQQPGQSAAAVQQRLQATGGVVTFDCRIRPPRNIIETSMHN